MRWGWDNGCFFWDDLYRNLKEEEEEEEEEKVLLKSERNRETITVVLRRLRLNFQLGKFTRVQMRWLGRPVTLVTSGVTCVTL